MGRKIAIAPLKAAALLSAMSLALAMPVMAQDRAGTDRPVTGTLGSFTPSGNGNTSLTESESRFSFTPSGAKEKKRGVSVGVTGRVVRDTVKPAPSEVTAARARTARAPIEVEAKLDVGYRGFSLSGGVVKENDRTLGVERQGTEVGFAYAGKRWRAGVEAGATAPADASRILPNGLGEAEHVELGGAYSLSPRLSVRGGVRYDRLHPEAYGRDFVNLDEDTAEESGTVYLGTSFSF
ncbi:hypothetical protein KCG44_13050 [Pacificimonas sp. WHA3]|uniref:Porin domain-containing protein n=1 Tax=Pacificimonas pallii TaxID=2827236 RepID=A0ABS6SH38_9SPHN|nr:hypothetical protein [Pacificimonas pallii]MBV7257714.1 hypothetical protein [Pacificimonas pallii]